jgi:hypothetical protein
MDFRKLREQTMDRGEDEAVTVNTRALIDKVLARYSADWTTLRELIQNAADASATKVSIKFETIPSTTVPIPSQRSTDLEDTAPQEPHLSTMLKHVVKHHTLGRVIVSNNGEPFGTNDWNRLRRIAEGNPDETKIGAFGVGFYSVFADCEEPFVVSGRETMAFYWKGNSLFTRSGTLPNDEKSDTSFILEYRNTTTPVPDLLSMAQFLATSLTFVGLENIELFLDDWKILSLAKLSDPGNSLVLPRGINTKTSDSLMSVQSIFQRTSQIKGEWMNIIGWKPDSENQDTSRPVIESNPSGQLKSFFSKLTIGSSSASSKKSAEAKQRKRRQEIADASAKSQSVVFLRVSTVNIQTKITSASAKELERATKKPPPKQTTISILASPYDATSAMTQDTSGASIDIFATVLPSRNGRIFIGFPTAQTTGMLCHVSAPSIIPTVERENIDLNARYVRDWNSGLLRAAGIASRIVFEGEMNELRTTLQRKLDQSGKKRPSESDIESIIPAAVHVYNQHTARESTPSAVVGSIIEHAFWDCSKTASMEVLSNWGILPSSKVRIVSEDLSFLDNTPIVPSKFMEDAGAFIQKMFERGLLSSMTVQDIKRDLETKALDEKQLTEFLKWAVQKISRSMLSPESVQSMLEVTIATIGGESGQLLQIAGIKYFQNISKIPHGVPVPPDTMPLEVTRSFSVADLEKLGWEQLQLVPWTRYLVSLTRSSPGGPQDMTTSPDFASQVLQVLSKQWNALSASSKTTIVEMLTPLTVMPTKTGLVKPSESYFSNVKLFDDLPVIVGLQNIREGFLKDLGVRKTLELSVVFERLMNASAGKSEKDPKWSHVELIRYLVSVRADIPNKDIIRLRDTPICSVEKETGFNGDKNRLYKVSELYEPVQQNRDLQLPTLQWPGEFRPKSYEGQFLTQLGLRQYPSVTDIGNILIQSAKSNDQQLYNITMTYYITRYHVNGYMGFDTSKLRTWPILPAEGQKFPRLYSATSLYANPKAAVLGFRILRGDLQPHAEKFGVERDPSIQGCLDFVVAQPPRDAAQAKEIFGYLATRIVEIDNRMAERVGSSKIVPIGGKGSRWEGYSSPRMCFLGDPSTYGAIVPFVDFGQDANSFLLKVGSKHEPSSVELAWMIVDDPVGSLKSLGQEKYLDLLRKLAESKDSIKSDRNLWKKMRASQCLLGFAEVLSAPTTKEKDLLTGDGSASDGLSDDEDDGATSREWSLRSAQQLVVVDSDEDFRNFRRELIAAPDERVLEDFYVALGAPLLSSIVEVQQNIGGISRDQVPAEALQKLIVERARLFVHDYRSESIHHDAKWIDKNLSVQVATNISIRKSLKGYRANKSERRSAVLRYSKPPVLYITARYDLFEVSREIVYLLLKRPKQHDSLALDAILESKLSRLRAKGYNVDRILRRKEHESRLAEEQQRKMQEEQQRQAIEQNRALEQHQSARDTSPDRATHIPGAFEDSPDHGGQQQTFQENFTSLFNNFRRQVGLDNGDKRPETPTPGPSDYSQGQLTRGGGTSKPTTQLTSNYDQVQKNLQQALQSCRSHDSSSLNSNIDTSVVTEASGSYCDDSRYHDLVDSQVQIRGLKFFLARSLVGTTDTSAILNSPTHSYFAALVTALGSVFGVPLKAMHLFDDPNGRTIAFNAGGAIFCNYNFFRKLHMGVIDREATRKDILTAWGFWYTTIAHELAHNLERPHGPQHSFYTESFVSEFMPAFVEKSGQGLAF